MKQSNHLVMCLILAILSISVFFMTTPAYALSIISTEMEVELGRDMRDDILAEKELWEDAEDNRLILKMGEILVPLVEERTELEYEFYIVEDEEVNAYSLPGGIVFVNTGLLDFCERNPDMIAGVLAHEISHVARRHHKDSIEDALLGTLGMGMLFRIFGLDEDWQEIAAATVYTLVAQGHSRENEYDADEQAVKITYEAGWDPDLGMIEFLRETEKEYGAGNELGDFGRCISSHPDTDRRVYFAELFYEELKGVEEFHQQPIPQYTDPDIEGETAASVKSELKN